MFSLKSVFPNALRDRLFHRQSDVWNKDVDFSTNSYTSLVAPSGTGKTTLIHFLYNLRNDYSGIITYNNQNILDYDSEALSKIRSNEIAIVFQDLRLFPQLTIRENISLKKALGKQSVNLSIDVMAECLNISHILDKPAHICSYGEQQRAAIIRALAQPFTYLLLDEPFSHLDLENTQKAIDLIHSTCTENKAGLIIADLDQNYYFPYHQQYFL
ncbi:MAG: ATP-binding cassette domain-containing protein [Sediminibacterium sp.]|nr:ATP-binding cassette domain-containing protein [Sediminibacterium sp.]